MPDEQRAVPVRGSSYRRSRSRRTIAVTAARSGLAADGPRPADRDSRRRGRDCPTPEFRIAMRRTLVRALAQRDTSIPGCLETVETHVVGTVRAERTGPSIVRFPASL